MTEYDAVIIEKRDDEDGVAQFYVIAAPRHAIFAEEVLEMRDDAGTPVIAQHSDEFTIRARNGNFTYRELRRDRSNRTVEVERVR